MPRACMSAPSKHAGGRIGAGCAIDTLILHSFAVILLHGDILNHHEIAYACTQPVQTPWHRLRTILHQWRPYSRPHMYPQHPIRQHCRARSLAEINGADTIWRSQRILKADEGKGEEAMCQMLQVFVEDKCILSQRVSVLTQLGNELIEMCYPRRQIQSQWRLSLAGARGNWDRC